MRVYFKTTVVPTFSIVVFLKLVVNVIEMSSLMSIKLKFNEFSGKLGQTCEHCMDVTIKYRRALREIKLN